MLAAKTTVGKTLAFSVTDNGNKCIFCKNIVGCSTIDQPSINTKIVSDMVVGTDSGTANLLNSLNSDNPSIRPASIISFGIDFIDWHIKNAPNVAKIFGRIIAPAVFNRFSVFIVMYCGTIVAWKGINISTI